MNHRDRATLKNAEVDGENTSKIYNVLIRLCFVPSTGLSYFFVYIRIFGWDATVANVSSV